MRRTRCSLCQVLGCDPRQHCQTCRHHYMVHMPDTTDKGCLEPGCACMWQIKIAMAVAIPAMNS